MESEQGSSYSVSLSGDDDAELRGYWEKLSEGGSVSVPLEKQMWGDVFGMCTDRFGVPWMVNISRENCAAGRTAPGPSARGRRTHRSAPVRTGGLLL
jgi:uncharacterized glyoxalase superfamily protein PhnB